MKTCSNCKQLLNIDCFAKNRAKKDGLQGLCKICKKAVQAKYYHKNKKSYRETSNKSRQQRCFRNRVFVVEYLKNHPCVDCGEADIHVLEFDHVREIKVAGIGRMIADATPLEKIEEEISKCEVRCCNCHRKVTFQRRGIDFTHLL